MSLRSHVHVHARVRDRRDERWHAWLAGALTGFSLLIESKHRRTELMLYCLPRGVAVCWGLLRDRGVLAAVPGAEAIMFAVAMAVILGIDREHHKPAVQGILKVLFGSVAV